MEKVEIQKRVRELLIDAVENRGLTLYLMERFSGVSRYKIARIIYCESGLFLPSIDDSRKLVAFLEVLKKIREDWNDVIAKMANGNSEYHPAVSQFLFDRKALEILNSKKLSMNEKSNRLAKMTLIYWLKQKEKGG